MVRNSARTRKSERVPLYVDLPVNLPDPFRHGNRTAAAVGRSAILQFANGSPRSVCRAGVLRSTPEPDQCHEKKCQPHPFLPLLSATTAARTASSGERTAPKWSTA